MKLPPLTVVRTWLEPRMLAAIAGLAAASSLFIQVADEVVEGSTHAIDAAIILWLRPDSEPRWLDSVMRDITALGSIGVLSVIVIVSAVFLLLIDRTRTALFVLVGAGGGTALSSLLKELFDRARPDLVPHSVFVSSASFPSGHAMSSAVVYLTLGALLARLIPNRWVKLYIMGVAATLVVLVGVSRIYLGVHWPSDVLAGWAAGAAWALVCWVVAQLLRTGRAR